MEYRLLGRSGFKVPALTLAPAPSAARDEFFQAWGTTEPQGSQRGWSTSAWRPGVNMFDSADVYSGGASEEVLGAAIKGRRDKLLISTKSTFRCGDGPNDAGSSRYHIIDATRSRRSGVWAPTISIWCSCMASMRRPRRKKCRRRSTR